MGYIELRVKARPLGPLDTVVGPQDLRAVRDLDRVERALPGVRAGKRSMSRGVPVLAQDHMSEGSRQPVDRRDDCIAIGNGERTARAEIVLDIDDQQYVSIIWRHCLPLSVCWRSHSHMVIPGWSAGPGPEPMNTCRCQAGSGLCSWLPGSR